VGGISIQGNVKTRDAVIRREIRIYPGERYDGEKLRRSKERLYNLGYFEEVNFETVPSAERPDHRDLVVSVKEAKTGEFSFGGGFSSVDNFIGFVEIAQRNFDLFNWPTFTGGGQDLSFRVMAGTRRRNFELSFTEPWIFDRPYSAGFDLFNTTRTRGEGYSFELKRTGGALRLGHAIGDYNRVGLTYRLEAVHVSDVAESASAALKREIGESTVSSLRLSYTRDTRDNTFNPKRGYLLDNGIELAGSVLGGDRDFWRWTGSGSIFFQPFVEDQVLELRGSLGLADAMADSDFVPIFQRFFAGGADSIRGYRERRVGPKDPSTRDPVGGEAVAVFNAEYTVPVVEFLKVAGFYDIGNVWASLGDFASGGFRSGAGAGVRIKTPFGPVKLDYGWPINPERGERRNGRFHFSASRAF
jgi:outer membrane protein insertion porin family